jgi:DNA-binding transcriptional regulator LsrR (DeoR family)
MDQEEELAKSAWEHYRQVLNLSEIARRLNISRSLISQWKAIPSHQLSSVVKITGIPREKLRPTPKNNFPWESKGD